MGLRAQKIMKTTFASLFSGIGGADLGAIAAGLEHTWGLEYESPLAELYKANIGDCHVMNILDANSIKFDRPDWLHASPVCKSFSAANKNKGELQLDIDCAKKVVEFLEVLQPKHFSLENVQAYGKSHSFGLIVDALNRLGYWSNWQVLNSADFGVPQSRRRLILLAVKGGFLPSLPQKEKHVGWYEAIADLVHDLPDSKLADWQINALPKEIKDHYFVPYFFETGFSQAKNQTEPASTIMAFASGVGKGRAYKALLIENTGARSDRPLQTRNADEPCWTLRAMGQDGHYHRSNALVNSRVVALDIKCLARLQSFPDNYKWSDKKSLDGKGIGNSVTPLMFQKLITNMAIA